MSSKLTAALVTVVAAGTLAAGPERIDSEFNARIRQEEKEHSQIMRTLHFLTDVYGPRLTGSPNYKAAAEWVLNQAKEWGLQNGHLEPWTFGHPGWVNERFSGFVTSPVQDSLVGEVLAWTPSTSGTVTAAAMQVVPPDRPTEAELAAWIQETQPRLKGHIVLVGKPIVVPVAMTKPPLRRNDDDLRKQYDPVNPTPQRGRGDFRPAPDAPRRVGQLTANAINERIDAMLVAAGALVRVNDAGRDHGQIRAFNNRTFDLTKAIPTVVLRNEDYGRISRILEDGAPVTMEFTIVNRTFPEGSTSYNVIAEIPGTDRKDEVVMLGGHLDSWHAATGATDNAVGCAVMLEAARILAALGALPKRTIRLAFWGGEEQGLLGSKAYVKEHFGTFEEPKPEFAKFGGYLNVDSGTGRIRGANVFGPAEAATVLREALAPFEDLGVMGSVATRSRASGGTDSTSFNAAGLPGIGLSQDPIEYNSYTWHTSLDTYERIVAEDVQKSAIAIAAAAYHLAMRDELLPRFSKDEMPPPVVTPVARTGSGQ
jgi:hypothetical protein